MKTLSGNIVDVLSKTIRKGIIHFDTKIRLIEYKDVDSDLFIIPGFIDAHIHIESSMLIPSEFARLAVLHGTVATVSDPHEIGNVLGKDGVKFMIENGKKTPFKFHFGAPSCVPATIFETAGATISSSDIEEMMQWEDIFYLTEMMNFPGVFHRNEEVMRKIEIAKKYNKVIDGHLPGIVGEMAKDYAEQGITTDHECFELEEALEKLQYGMKIIIREGSAAKNFEALWPLIDRFPNQMMFCSDDKHPNDLLVSHINDLAKRAVSKGCDVFNVLCCCSKNPIEHYSLPVGLLQVQDDADFCLVKNLTDFEVVQTYIKGQLVAENNQSFVPSVPEICINNFAIEKIDPSDLKIEANGETINVISVEDGQLVTKKKIFPATIQDGFVESNVHQDVLKLVVVNRYAPSKPAIGFIHKIGLKKGAIASCVAHDSHNIIAVGTNDEDLCKAIQSIIDHKGGVSLVSDEITQIVPLPVAGIMSNKDAYQVAQLYTEIDITAKELGCTLQAPFMTLSFCALLVIPELKLSDLGLFDGNLFEFRSLFS